MRRERRGRAVRGRRLASLLISAASAASFGFACGSDEQPKTPTELYPSRYADSVCAVWEPCCRANGLTFNRDKCGLAGAIYVQGGVDNATKAGATLDPKKADACIAAAVAATKTCTLVQDDPTARVACATVWSGPKKVGESCNGDLDCETTDKGQGVCLKPAGPDNPGVCAIRTSDAKLGDVCGQAPNGAVPTTVADCDGNDMQCTIPSATCGPLVALGGTCGTFNRCVKGAFCGSGVCKPGLEAGVTCSENEPAACKSGVCIHGQCAANAVGTLVACTGEM